MSPLDHARYIRDLKADYNAQWALLLRMYRATTTDKDELEQAETELERLEDLLIQEGVAPDA